MRALWATAGFSPHHSLTGQAFPTQLPCKDTTPPPQKAAALSFSCSGTGEAAGGTAPLSVSMAPRDRRSTQTEEGILKKSSSWTRTEEESY